MFDLNNLSKQLRQRSFEEIGDRLHIIFHVHVSQIIKRCVFYKKNFYRKVALKNHISPFLKFEIINTQLIMH